MKNYYDSHKDECTEEILISKESKLEWLRLTQERIDFSNKIITPVVTEARKMLHNGIDKDEVSNFIIKQTKGIDTVEIMILLHEVSTYENK